MCPEIVWLKITLFQLYPLTSSCQMYAFLCCLNDTKKEESGKHNYKWYMKINVALLFGFVTFHQKCLTLSSTYDDDSALPFPQNKERKKERNKQTQSRVIVEKAGEINQQLFFVATINILPPEQRCEKKETTSTNQ